MPAAPNGGLNYGASSFKPVRGATVELIDALGSPVATTTTTANGDYRFTLPAPQPLRLRVRAELISPNYTFRVRDNTSSNALYVLDSAAFTPASESTIFDVAASSGWSGTSYTSTRAAAPFAVLDVAYMAKEKVMAVSPATTLPTLSIFWSPNNRPAAGSVSDGNIGTSFFTGSINVRSLYLLGAENSDTDEYDVPVVAHELGHFMQHALSRDDSQGGAHNGGDKLDMRIAFSEGWGNAWASMVSNSPVYHDSAGSSQAGGFAYSVETPPDASYRGWFNETTVAHLLWQSHQDGGIGFAPIFSALSALKYTPVFTSIHSFTHHLKAAKPNATGVIESRAAAVGITGNDLYGSGETNTGGVGISVPVYKTHFAGLGSTQQYCLQSPRQGGNKLGDYVYIRLTTSGVRSITVTRAAGTVDSTNPELMLVRSDGRIERAASGAVDQEVLTVQSALAQGTHVLALNDASIDLQPSAPVTQTARCFDVRVD